MVHELRPAQLRRVLSLSSVEGASATVVMSMLGGTFLTAFALSLGASPWQVGLMASLGPAMQVGQVFAAYFVERGASRRSFAHWLLGIHRILWSTAGLVALLLPRGWNLPVFMLMYAAAWLLAAPGINAWQSLMSEVVPRQVRGRYFGTRWMMNTVLGMGALMAAGWVVDNYPGKTGFAALYGVAMLISLLNWYLLTELSDVPNRARPGISYWEHLLGPLRNTGFRRVTLWLAGWTLVQLALPPFYTVLMAEEMSLSYSLISVLSAVTAVCSAASFPLWGRFIDRRGPFALAAPGVVGAAAVPMLWLMARSLGSWYLFPVHALFGLAAAGLQTITLQMGMRLAPPSERAIHLAMMNGANGLAGFVGPLVAGVLAEAGRFDLLFGGAGVALVLLGAAWRFWLATPDGRGSLTKGERQAILGLDHRATHPRTNQ